MWILNASIPTGLVSLPAGLGTDDPELAASPDWVLVHLEVSPQSQQYQSLYPAATTSLEQLPLQPGDLVIDQQGGVLLPCFVDSHTHLDKAQAWHRAPNTSGTFEEALSSVIQDGEQHWTEEDIYQRMDFALRCSYAHGTQALRTHLDSSGALGERVWSVFEQIRRDWSDRLHLQGVALVPPAYYQTAAGEVLVERVAQFQGILGGVCFTEPDLEPNLDRLFQLAQRYGLALDFHADESNRPEDQSLLAIARAKQRHSFTGQVICGHCCSLSQQPESTLSAIIDAVKEADIGIVSLPMCNLYLQDRQAQRTPRWRGVTALQELKAAGVAVALASDNCRDPFYAYGDHDGLEVLRESIRIAHLDCPVGDWVKAVTQTPATWMGLGHYTQIAIAAPANFILFRGRNWNELLSRPESDRRVFRKGKEIDTTLPHYGELDSLMTREGVS